MSVEARVERAAMTLLRKREEALWRFRWNTGWGSLVSSVVVHCTEQMDLLLMRIKLDRLPCGEGCEAEWCIECWSL